MVLTPDVLQVRNGLVGPQQKIFDTVVSLAEKVDPSFQNRMQWRLPTFTLNDNWNHWIFSLGRTKMGMTVTFHKGWLLEDPRRLLSGAGNHLRMLRFTDAAQIQKELLQDLFRAAIRHQFDL